MSTVSNDMEMSDRLRDWQNEEAELLNRLEDIESKHGFLPHDLSEELSRLLEVKLERLKKLQGKVQSSARKEVEPLVEAWQGEEGNLIMILHAVQKEHGYIPRDVAMELSRMLDVKLARIYEVITFYHYFKLVPPGKHDVAVCMGTACYLKGAANLLSQFESDLGVEEGKTTADRLFHLSAVRCIGCCGMAPAVVVDGHTHGKVKTSEVRELLDPLRHEENHAEKA